MDFTRSSVQIALASDSSGLAPGRRTRHGHAELLGSAPRLIEAIRPARASDVLPLPEEPTMARKRSGFALVRLSHSLLSANSIRASRPQKNGASSTSKDCSPL